MIVNSVFISAYIIATLASLLLTVLYAEHKRKEVRRHIRVICVMQLMIETVLIALLFVLEDYFALLWASHWAFVVIVYAKDHLCKGKGNRKMQ